MLLSCHSKSNTIRAPRARTSLAELVLGDRTRYCGQWSLRVQFCKLLGGLRPAVGQLARKNLPLWSVAAPLSIREQVGVHFFVISTGFVSQAVA